MDANLSSLTLNAPSASTGLTVSAGPTPAAALRGADFANLLGSLLADPGRQGLAADGLAGVGLQASRRAADRADRGQVEVERGQHAQAQHAAVGQAAALAHRQAEQLVRVGQQAKRTANDHGGLEVRYQEPRCVEVVGQQGEPLPAPLALAASCSAAIHPSVRASNAATSWADRCRPIASAKLGANPARVIYSAAHVVADPFTANDPSGRASVDWGKTMEFRRYLAGLGLGIAEAMRDKAVDLILKRLLEKGRIVYKRAYCDWNRYRGAVPSAVANTGRIIPAPSRAAVPVAATAKTFNA